MGWNKNNDQAGHNSDEYAELLGVIYRLSIDTTGSWSPDSLGTLHYAFLGCFEDRRHHLIQKCNTLLTFLTVSAQKLLGMAADIGKVDMKITAHFTGQHQHSRAGSCVLRISLVSLARRASKR